jgi:hypothetical protein
MAKFYQLYIVESNLHYKSRFYARNIEYMYEKEIY